MTTMTAETITITGGNTALEVIQKQWLEAIMPEASDPNRADADARHRVCSRIMFALLSSGFTAQDDNVYAFARHLICEIVAGPERASAADDYATILVEQSQSTDVFGADKRRLINEARLVCTPRYFTTLTGLFYTYLHVATASECKLDFAQVRQIVLQIKDSPGENEALAWCWQKLHVATDDIHDAERYVAAGGTWADLGYQNMEVARRAHG